MSNPRSLFTIQSPTNASFSSHFTLKNPSKSHKQPFPPKLVSYRKLTFRVHCSSQPSRTPQNSNLISTLIKILRVVPDWADKIQEGGMRKKRSLYKHETWVQHRSSLRTEASYSRFEAGKKAWTKVIAGTNDFARQVIACVDKRDDMLKEALLHYIMAFPIALKCHIVYDSDIASDLKNLVEADDLAVILSSKHRPRCIIGFISQSLQSLNLEGAILSQLESKISCFHEGIGICEQLLGIPIPLSYTRLTSRFLVLWHLTLPIILWDDCHWIVVPATFISAASLFCIEEVGVLIEEPFPMLALDELCQRVHDNIQEAMANEKQIQEILNSKRKRRFSEHSPNGWPTS
ncbi:voltage-dependent chloride channel 1, chloroplastic-like isoform X3 [Solanum dulcamara]|uniref:voltage-dependent chloride channel 1, chloroplastic-like isoform X3 n=1 Tax=Solanum dulcamara TaxID=45834 RepID=UPI002485F3F7|nr:voltage-dependent chloride channel 1, chloroplastic-like isoform X3 [Solanum dulcamara]